MLDGGFELAGQSVKQSRIQLFTAILISNNLVESWVNSFPVKHIEPDLIWSWSSMYLHIYLDALILESRLHLVLGKSHVPDAFDNTNCEH